MARVTRAGVSLAYEEYHGPDGPDAGGERPALLLIQGLGYPRWGWEPLIGPLSRSFRVIAFDNRGIGDSDTPPGPYDIATLAADATAVLDAAGVDRAHVMGASLGGMIAQGLALTYPERVDRLVLACTTPGGEHAFPLPAATQALIAGASALPPEEATRRFVHNALGDDRPDHADLVAELVARRMARPQSPEGWRSQAAAALGHDAWAGLPRIAAPTLIVHGTADKVVDPRNADLLAGRICGARVEMLDGLGHLFFWEEPDRVAARVTAFLDQVSSPAGRTP
jgi:3-oxoadipate enol-lactonase